MPTLEEAYAVLARSNIHVNRLDSVVVDGRPEPVSLEVGYQVRFTPTLTKFVHIALPWVEVPGVDQLSEEALAENISLVADRVREIRRLAEKF